MLKTTVKAVNQNDNDCGAWNRNSNDEPVPQLRGTFFLVNLGFATPRPRIKHISGFDASFEFTRPRRFLVGVELRLLDGV
jgi:hypothetical protein